mmetsp:Transcript_7944/g.23677  ORF Transcript_7944/g.23677 Transcript_7944/m.23677 type:complete len:368 (+) Transcript_7944:165-1268(+)
MLLPRIACLAVAAHALAPLLSKELATHEVNIRNLRRNCADVLPRTLAEAEPLLDGYADAYGDLEQGLDAFCLRFVADVRDGIDLADAETKLRESMEWRRGAGAALLETAREAVQRATTCDDGDSKTTAARAKRWKNSEISERAPAATVMSEYMTEEQLCYLLNKGKTAYFCCVKSGKIDADAMMSALERAPLDDEALLACVAARPAEASATLAQRRLQHFFLYSKAVNARSCAALTARTGRRVSVATANDLRGVDLRGGTPRDRQFRLALSAAAKRGDALFPGLAGPTVVCNLPRALQVLVGLLSPLFPKSVRRFLTFARVDEFVAGRVLLTDAAAQEKFLGRVEGEIDRMLARLPPVERRPLKGRA